MLKRIIRIGFPAGVQSILYSVSNVIIQSAVNSLGTNNVAAWAAYGKVDGLFWMMINALGIAATTFVGQNYGAKKDGSCTPRCAHQHDHGIPDDGSDGCVYVVYR